MVWSIWEGQRVQMVAGSDPPIRGDGSLDDPEAVKVKEFEAESYEAAMQVWNDHYGWGKYKPMTEEDMNAN